MSNYSEKLKDPRWQKKRLKILERDDFTCKSCGDKQNTLEIHHIAYVDDSPWKIDESLLVTLCSICHKEEQEGIKEESSTLIRELKEKGFMANDIMGLYVIINKLSKEEIINHLLYHPKNNG